jgi:SAM-dependent methyltransferase
LPDLVGGPPSRSDAQAPPSGEIETVWEGGIGEELTFWDRWFATSGGQWPDDYRLRLDPATPLQETFVKRLDPSRRQVAILDVGAGPLTIVGKRWPDHVVAITAVDALAHEYRALYERFRVRPPVPTTYCHSEKLSERFRHDTFDLAYARNTLDHSYDPLRAIREMVHVVKPGGIVLLEHFPNEAETERYSGLHQWNFDEAGGECIVWRPDHRFKLSEVLGGTADVRCESVDGRVLASIRVREPS